MAKTYELERTIAIIRTNQYRAELIVFLLDNQYQLNYIQSDQIDYMQKQMRTILLENRISPKPKKTKHCI